jgi:predicted aldo/keto reductase-like oxidoreductase
VASLEGILCVLSGMSSVAQMEDNLSYMRDFKPLAEDERAVLREAQRILGSSPAIPCTSCEYCTKGCPKHINIPGVFAAMNSRLLDGAIKQASVAYAEATAAGGRASDCIGCGQCERACPQHIPIIDQLKRCADTLETRGM